MKQILQQTTKMCKAESVLNMFKIMCREKLTLKTVETMCKKLCYPRIERRRDPEKRIMEWKLSDAKSVVAIEKKRLTLEWIRNIEILKEFRINKSIKKIAKRERTIQKYNLKREKRKKVDFLRRRRENETKSRDQCRSNRDYLCSIVITHDQEIPLTFDNAPRIYGGAEFNEKEMKALRLPPKYTVYEKVNKERCQIEIAYHYDIDSKKLDFRKIRPTDMPDNKKIYLAPRIMKKLT